MRTQKIDFLKRVLLSAFCALALLFSAQTYAFLSDPGQDQSFAIKVNKDGERPAETLDPTCKNAIQANFKELFQRTANKSGSRAIIGEENIQNALRRFSQAVTLHQSLDQKTIFRLNDFCRAELDIRAFELGLQSVSTPARGVAIYNLAKAAKAQLQSAKSYVQSLQKSPAKPDVTHLEAMKKFCVPDFTTSVLNNLSSPEKVKRLAENLKHWRIFCSVEAFAQLKGSTLVGPYIWGTQIQPMLDTQSAPMISSIKSTR